MERPTNRHIDFLDPIRGIAILLVFLFHSLGIAFGRDELPWGPWFRDFNVSGSFLLLLPATFGWAGVAIFFVVSGFCIHLSFSRQPDWTLFVQRRFFRIYPPYLVALLFFAFLFPITRFNLASHHSVGMLVSHLGLFHNLLKRWIFGINPSFWSIAVEVQLYALYPLLLLLASRFGWGYSLIGIAAIEVTLRLTDGILLTAGAAGLPKWLSGSPFYCWFSWSLGAFIAERYLRGAPIPASRFAVWAAGIAAAGCSFFKPLSSMQFLLFALLAAGVIAQLLRNPNQPLPIPRALRAHLQQAGVWSFSLYLLHQPLIHLAPRLASKVASGAHIPPLLMFVLCLLSWFLIVPLARLSYQLIELPSIAFGKAFQKKRGCKSAQVPGCSTGERYLSPVLAEEARREIGG